MQIPLIAQKPREKPGDAHCHNGPQPDTDGLPLVAIVGCWHQHLLAMHRAGVGGDRLINHPSSLVFISKLNSLCGMTLCREMAAFDAIDKLCQGESVEYEVIPL